MILACSVLLSLLSLSSALFTQSAGVKGVLLCGDRPLANTKVKLYDDDSGPDLDDLLAEATTDSLGHFLLSGHTSEVMTIDPKLNVYHDCDDGLKPCQRKVSFYIPKVSILNTNESRQNKFQDYVSSGEHPKQYFDIGVLNMQTVFASEERG
ncbi:hypothetical protein WR25_09743 [Diploscapter pachys]|uniref:Transthyretin/hydroxyisourate hydrolase domain-containing protein n=1 Tax=Diploscapter pachys TaxID=2018661 RepID=A0A2A2K308_9BILA|nr:hypothetical protein WR25_09743 [Diploscapter pachys]